MLVVPADGSCVDFVDDLDDAGVEMMHYLEKKKLEQECYMLFPGYHHVTSNKHGQ